MDKNNTSPNPEIATLRVSIPLEITVRVADPADARASVASALPTERLSPAAAAGKLEAALAENKSVVKVRAGLLYKDGYLTDKRGIILKVRPEASRDPKDYGIGPEYAGVPVSIELASLESLATVLAQDAGMPGLEAPVRQLAYKRALDDSRFALNPVEDEMVVKVAVSPESGWRHFYAFLTGYEYRHMSVGIYNFTAPHIIEVFENKLQAGVSLSMSIDRRASDSVGGDGLKKDDWHEEKVIAAFKRDAGDAFRWAPASLSGPDRLFSTAYHIKVCAVGDLERAVAFHLSSGNWASTNQPDFTDADNPVDSLTWPEVKDGDRDWHVVVEHEKLATTMRNHLEQDYADNNAAAGEEAAAPQLPDLLVPLDYFLEAPRRVINYHAFKPCEFKGKINLQILLTPDNYPSIVAEMIAAAKESVLFINQSFDIKDDPEKIPEHYRKLLDALLDRQKAGLDVKVIFRSGFGKEQDVFRSAVEFGFKADTIKFYSTCHTKGIIIDGQHVFIGSQNWTGDGTGPNRDAGVFIRNNAEIAKYFTDVFMFDWENLATNRVAQGRGKSSSAHIVSDGEESALSGSLRRVPWGIWRGS